jgi:hypothetical protein
MDNCTFLPLPRLVKIGHLVQKLEGEIALIHIEHTAFVSLLCFPEKGVQLSNAGHTIVGTDLELATKASLRPRPCLASSRIDIVVRSERSCS